MIHFEPIPEPPRFDEEVRRPGNAWLEANPGVRPEKFPTHWIQCLGDLSTGFRDLCGYSAMWTSRPTVDHYLCKSSRDGRSLTYEWDNYRLADIAMNSAKGTWDRRILDPFEVENDWFEIRLPNLELIAAEERIPRERLDDVRFTLKKLGLRDSEDVLEIRRAWYREFTDGDVTLSWLARRAPLIARAIARRLEQINPADFDDEQTHLRWLIDGDMPLKTLRVCGSRLADFIDAALRS
jgi:hypothetical protein